MIEGEVDLAEGRFDRAIVGGGLRRRSSSKGGERAEQPGAELDQEDAELEAACRQAIAPGVADPLDEAVGAELAEVVAELAQAVVGLGEAMAVEQPGQDVAGGPVGDEAAGVEQDVEQAEDSVVLE